MDDIIYYKNQIYLILDSALKRNIIQASHDSPLSGHQVFLKTMQALHDSPLSGHQVFLKTYKHIRERFPQKGLKEDVIQHVQECSICQQNKIEHTHPAGLPQTLPLPEQKWESILMDFITGLPKVHG